LKTPQTGETVRVVGIGGSAGIGGFAGIGGAAAGAARRDRSAFARRDRPAFAARRDRSARAALAITVGLATVVVLAVAGSASAADDPLGAVTQASAPVTDAATPATNAAAPTANAANAGAAETAGATTAAVQTAAKVVHVPSPTTDRDVSETVRSAGAVVDSATRTVKRTADSAVATTTHAVDAATRAPAAATAAPAQAAHPKPLGLKVESSHARPPSRHPGVRHHRTAEPHSATAARALDPTPAPLAAASLAPRDLVAPAASSGRGERAGGRQPTSPAAPSHGGVSAAGASAAASGVGIAALLVATFLLAAPAIRRRLPGPSPGHWPAAPVFLLERPG
jgi:hypothetical protein